MYKGHNIGVVIPCYRVENSVAQVIAEIPDFVDAIVAVNDASPDKTLEVLNSIKSDRLTVISHEQNMGVGGAMTTGFAKIIEMNMDIVVKMDGDGQMKGTFMVDLIDPICEGVCDYAKGNRFLHSSELSKMPVARIFGNVCLTFLTKIASGYWHVFDPQNGYVALRVDYLRLLNLPRLRTRRYFFENEMLIRLNIESARVLDCAMPAVYGGETSSLKISRILTYFPYFLFRGFMARLFHRYVMRDFSVVIPLYLMGFGLFVWGFIFGLFTWIRAVHAGVPATTGTVMLSALPLILGFQMILQGLMFEIMMTPRANKPTSRAERLPRSTSQGQPTGEEPSARSGKNTQ